MESPPHPLRAWRAAHDIGLRAFTRRLTGADGAPLISYVSLSRIECGLQPPSIEVMLAVKRETGGAVRPDHMAAAYRAPRAREGAQA